MNFSSRELLGLTAFVGLTIASMRIGGIFAAVTLAVCAFTVNALLIVAFIDRTNRRAFAIGFLVPLLSYAGVHFFPITTNSIHMTISLCRLRDAYSRYIGQLQNRLGLISTLAENFPTTTRVMILLVIPVVA